MFCSSVSGLLSSSYDRPMASPASTPSSTPSLPSLLGHVKIKKEVLDHPHDMCKGEYSPSVLRGGSGVWVGGWEEQCLAFSLCVISFLSCFPRYIFINCKWIILDSFLIIRNESFTLPSQTWGSKLGSPCAEGRSSLQGCPWAQRLAVTVGALSKPVTHDAQYIDIRK